MKLVSKELSKQKSAQAYNTDLGLDDKVHPGVFLVEDVDLLLGGP